MPWHYSKSKQKNSSQKWIFLILFIVIAMGGLFIFSKGKSIRLFFSGNHLQKIEKERTRISQSVQKNTLNQNSSEDFLALTQEYIDKNPLNPEAYFFSSLAYYFQSLLLSQPLDSYGIIQSLQIHPEVTFGESSKMKRIMERIFLESKKAKSLGDLGADSDTNDTLIVFSEIYRSYKDPKDIFLIYSKIQPDKIPSEMKLLYVWMGIYLAAKNGDTPKILEYLNNKEDLQKKYPFMISKREEAFLRGYALYCSKKYIEALQQFKDAKSDSRDDLDFWSALTEADIHHKQNLSQKSIEILETYYEKDSPRMERIMELLRKIIYDKPSLKTRIPIT
jgi:tetratricopeptide (TPR) repeat protein